jgi:uncharacterized SAM-binding protein YcdF (DUF218 family)
LDGSLAILATKVLSWLFYPLTLAGVAMLFVVAARGVRPLPRAAAALALLALWGGGCRFTSETLVRSLEGYSRPPAADVRAEAIVVLGGGVQPAFPPRRAVELSDAGDRVLEAARLFREGRAPIVVPTGGPFDRAIPQSTEMAELLRFMGVPAEAIVEQDKSRNTREDAVEVRAVLAPRGAKRILLVTSALHMRRAAALFRAQGFEVVPAPTDFLAVDAAAVPRGVSLITLLPNAESLATTTRALREWVGLGVAAVLGWTA